MYIWQAPTVEVKVAWLTEIRKILNNQQKSVKGFYIPVTYMFVHVEYVSVSYISYIFLTDDAHQGHDGEHLLFAPLADR